MIVHDFSLPVKFIRIGTYYFQLMLALVILQIGPSVVFAFNLFLILLELFANNWVSEVLKKSKTFELMSWYRSWELVRTLVAAWYLR